MSGFQSGLKLLNKIDEGHFGEVYLGEDQVHGRVAVKVLTRKHAESDAEWEVRKKSFLSEGQHLSKATHRNVVQVHYIVEADDGKSVQLCMAYCPKGSLQKTYEFGPMTLPQVRRVGTDVLMGLAALHARDMLHRDIKPGNILLNEAAIYQISDFGLVTDDLILGYGSQAGYSDHIAFEIWQGEGTSVKSDIWAVGMTLFRLLHGDAWYAEMPSPQNIVRDGGFARTLVWLPHIPKPWRRVIRQMLNDDRALRFQTANQALEALSRLAVAPVWSATVSPQLVRWEQESNARRNIVEWKRHSQRRHEWSAWSEPLAAGRKRQLAGSSGIVGKLQAMAELERYFAG